jgi:hypothetical protein
MNKDDIIKLAQEAGFGGFLEPNWDLREELERFADLVAAAEREACAKVCEEWGAWNNVAQDCAAAIRARGKQ